MSQVEPIMREVTFRASREALYDAFTVPEHLLRWFAERVRIDVTPGGVWRFDWPGGMAAEGHVRRTDRPARYVWTWEKSIMGDEVMGSEVVIDYSFDPIDEGTLVRIRESGHETDDIRDMNAGGIDQMIGTLRAYVEDGIVVDWTAPLPEAGQ